MADAMRTIEYVMIGLMAYQLVRFWWRLNRRRAKKWWQRVKDWSVSSQKSRGELEGWGEQVYGLCLVDIFLGYNKKQNLGYETIDAKRRRMSSQRNRIGSASHSTVHYSRSQTGRKFHNVKSKVNGYEN